MAIKKTAKMSAAPKKVASKKSDPGKGFVSSVKGVMGSMVSKTKQQAENKKKEDASNRKKAYWLEEYTSANTDKKRSAAKDSLVSLGVIKPTASRKKP